MELNSFAILHSYRFQEMLKDTDNNIFIMVPDMNIGNSDKFNQTSSGKDLHVFIPNDQRLTESLDHLFGLYDMRTRKNRDFWLLDLSNINETSRELIDTKLRDLPGLDFDDDLHLLELSKVEINDEPEYDHPW